MMDNHGYGRDCGEQSLTYPLKTRRVINENIPYSRVMRLNEPFGTVYVIVEICNSALTVQIQVQLRKVKVVDKRAPEDSGSGNAQV